MVCSCHTAPHFTVRILKILSAMQVTRKMIKLVFNTQVKIQPINLYKYKSWISKGDLFESCGFYLIAFIHHRNFKVISKPMAIFLPIMLVFNISKSISYQIYFTFSLKWQSSVFTQMLLNKILIFKPKSQLYLQIKTNEL